ncbi:muscleblind-like protein 1, partial [Limulus polyphemus]|uniref:Muscleblind-like protein 1 n=1 Tax=Limulus polyphemus TaxID=6850 RepID=A0ABM1T6R2_LIMPO
MAMINNVKDSRWLQLEVCREYQRNKCSRPDTECKFAHPPANIEVQDGRVVACYDSIKAITNPYLVALPTVASPTSFTHYLTPSPVVSMMPPDAMAAPLSVVPTPLVTTQKVPRTDRLEVCREFQRGNCKRVETECRFAHPPEHVTVDSTEGMVTVCMDFVKGRCMRDPCRYFHPPPHLQAQLKAAQSRANAAALPHVVETLVSKKRPRDPADDLILVLALSAFACSSDFLIFYSRRCCAACHHIADSEK